MTATLRHDLDAQGARFWVEQEGRHVPFSMWGQGDLHLEDGGKAHSGSLNGLVHQEVAVESEDGLSVCVPHAALAGLEAWQAKGLGLPRFAPFRLDIRTMRTLANTDFSVQYGFLKPDMLPASVVARQGAVLECSDGVYLLSDPLFSVVELLDVYRAAPLADMDERFLWWGKVRELLPDDVNVGQFLRNIHIVKPESFTLDFTERDGRLVFIPRFVLPAARLGDSDIQTQDEPESLVTPVVHGEFATTFCREPKARARYGLSHNWFVVVPPAVREALQVVREMHEAPPERQRAFLLNPRAELRRALEHVLPPEDKESILDDLFVETPLFLSERIKCLGVWEPKAGLFIKTESGQWLPGDALPPSVGLVLEGGVYPVAPVDLPVLAEVMEKADTYGKPEVTLGGITYPVTPASRVAVARAANIFAPPKSPEPEGNNEVAGQVKSESPDKLAPIIYDHIQELGIAVKDGVRERVEEAEPEFTPGVKLHEHQQHGLEWLKAHWSMACPGALLADDMGLGKTLQTLAFLSWVRRQMALGAVPQRPLLVVAPTGLLKNWEAEAAKFLLPSGLGELLPAYGARLTAMSAGGWYSMAAALRRAGWVLTTYETLRDKILGFTGVHFAVAVFDEAQKIKNPKSMLTEMAKSVKAEFTLALTGTPVENSLADLWCILDAVKPGHVKTLKEFASRYMPDGKAGEEQLVALKSELAQPQDAPIMLRRSKEEHWRERPEKREALHEVAMPSLQAQAYTAAVLRAHSAAGRKGAMLEALQSLRAISLHPTMLDECADHDAFIGASARLTMTFSLLDDIATQGAKVLIFVEYLRMQSVLSEIITRRYGCPQVMIISGQVSGTKRQARVDEFQRSAKGFDVMLLSPKAGGVGLTLTAATHVIHLSRWWNPAVEDQCSDRAYRIGQTQPVTVHYPLAVHPEYGREQSFDIKLHELLVRKRHLSRALLTPPAGTDQDVAELFANTVERVSGGAPPRSGGKVREEHMTLEGIAVMEPLQFEQWVLSRYARRGYQVRSTPVTGDAGADGIALAPTGGGPNYLIQCKHTQSQGNLDHAAVEEVLRAVTRYPDLPGNTIPVVVTNAKGFSARARSLAQGRGVELKGRGDLLRL